MSMADNTRQAVARQRAAARGYPVREQAKASSNPFSDDEDSSFTTSGTSLTSRSSNPFDEEVVSHNRAPRHDTRQRALRPTQDRTSSGGSLGGGNNPFDEPEVTSKSSRGSSRSQESSRRFPSSSSNPFDDEEAGSRSGSGSGSGSGRARSARAKTENSHRVSAGDNPFDDEGLVFPERPRPRSKHNSMSAVESGTSNPFDDGYDTPVKHNSLSTLERDSLFGSDEKVSKSQGPSRRSSGASELSEEFGPTSGSPKRGSGRALKEKLSTMYSEGVEKVAVVTEKVSAATESVSTRIQKPRRSSRADGERRARQERDALFGDDTHSRPPAPVPTPRYNDEGSEGQSVEQLRTYAHEKSRETSSSIQNCLRVAESTRDVASSTLAQIHEQGVQIRRTHETAVKVDEELSTGEKLLGSLGGIFSKTWKPKKTHAISGPADTHIADYRRKEYVQERASLVHGDTSRTSKLSSSQLQAMEPWEQERLKQDDDLDKLSNILDGLKDISHHMGAEIGKQNDSLEDLQKDVTELNFRVKQSNERGRKLLGR